MRARHRALLLPASLVWLLAAGPGCDGGDKGRGSGGKSAAGKHQAITLRAQASVDTPALLTRLRQLLSRTRPPILVKGSQESTPLAAVARGPLHLVLDSRPPPRSRRPREVAPPRVVLLGAETVAVLTNATNPIDRLSLGDLQRMLRGRVQSWKQVRGPRLPLITYTLGAQSDLTALLRDRFTGGKPFDPSVRQVEDVATLLESVRRTPGALGLLATYQLPPPPVGKLTPPGIKMLALSPKVGTPGYLATDRSAATKGRYPLLFPVVLVVRLPQQARARAVVSKLLAPKMLPHLSVQLGLVPLPAGDHKRTQAVWDRWLDRRLK